MDIERELQRRLREVKEEARRVEAKKLLSMSDDELLDFCRQSVGFTLRVSHQRGRKYWMLVSYRGKKQNVYIKAKKDRKELEHLHKALIRLRDAVKAVEKLKK